MRLFDRDNQGFGDLGFGGNAAGLMGGRMPPPDPSPRGIFNRPRLPMARPMSFKKGGRVRKTGYAKVHKGERIIPAGASGAMGGKKAYPKSKRAKTKIKKTMDEWKSGTLHSGSKTGPKVTNQKQAVAIAINQARRKA